MNGLSSRLTGCSATPKNTNSDNALLEGSSVRVTLLLIVIGTRDGVRGRDSSCIKLTGDEIESSRMETSR